MNSITLIFDNDKDCQTLRDYIAKAKVSEGSIGQLWHGLLCSAVKQCTVVEVKGTPPDEGDEQAYREAARDYQRDGDLEFDDNAVVSLGDDPGAYVQCWKWIPKSHLKGDTTS